MQQRTLLLRAGTGLTLSMKPISAAFEKAKTISRLKIIMLHPRIISFKPINITCNIVKRNINLRNRLNFAIYLRAQNT